ncbi:hypothetical protein GIB67_005743 [Kingdonia uniflora]|uniref:Tyrosine specific protein phosphatases domain-containing protein n=1 Tax=Kingdonia uniflora TaxID=39325 RepID=A0A7J7KVH5_9MAGN|nr:hypothetical protein GIB67_005743 [Kingdonia uniflora]
MNSIQILPSCFRSFSALPLQGTLKTHGRNPSCLINVSEVHCGLSSMDQSPSIAMRAVSGSKSSPTSNSEKSDAKEDEKKSDTYSDDMTQAMGAALTYRHELGMNYNFICPDLIVGSCLQTPKDVDKLRSIGVKTIFCLQQNSDLEYPISFVFDIYFELLSTNVHCLLKLIIKVSGTLSLLFPIEIVPFCFDSFTSAARYFSVDIIAIQEYAKQYDDIEHIRAEIRDFDAFDLRTRLPAVVSKLYKAVNRNGGVTYIHCTAGLGRAPATAAASGLILDSEGMHWLGRMVNNGG